MTDTPNPADTPRDPDADRAILAQLAPVPPSPHHPRAPRAPQDSRPEDPRTTVTRSIREHQLRRDLGKANQSGTGVGSDHAKVTTPRRTGVVGTAEMVAMCSDLARRFYAELDDQTKTDAQTKHVATSFAIIADKLSIWTARPANPATYEEAETSRPALLELAREIAQAAE